MSYDPSQEVRFAVVMYGGVSLAIYMNGVAQELLHAVRATADLPKGAKLDGSERVYREIGRRLFWGREAGDDSISDEIQTRIVVDILSGTSAGGINAVFLAKALARKESLQNLKQMWLEEADIDTLLNDARSDLKRYPTGAPKASLLNSNRMYELLVKALNNMDADGGEETGGPLADQIDLFVTATDLNGLEAPIELTDKWADERIHRTVFHFQSDGDGAGDFERRYNRMLAFAARCTSSFPAAFEPMQFRSIGPNSAEERDYSRFFESYVCRAADYVKRPFADGGILDNKPFSYAIDAIKYRDTTRPVERKLLFLDPSPEHASGNNRHPEEFDFLRNAMSALVTLPGYETIRGDIERINERNRYLNRLHNLRKRLKDDHVWDKLPSRSVPDFGARDLNSMVDHYGAYYAPCHHIKVFGVTDWLARVATRVMGFNAESDEYRAIRQLIRVWREDHYAANPGRGTGKETENRFLLDFDIEYRLRRLHHIREEIDERLRQEKIDERLGPKIEKRLRQEIEERLRQEIDERLSQEEIDERLRQEIEERLRQEIDERLRQEETKRSAVRDTLKVCRRVIQGQLTALFRHGQELESRTDSPIAGALHDPEYVISGDHLLAIIEPSSEGDQLERARRFYERLKPMFERAAGELAEHLKETFTKVSRAATFALDQNGYAEFGREAQAAIESLAEKYQTYDRRDCLVLPFLAGTGIEEMGEVGIFRVSPADAALCPQGDGQRERKLAGVKLGHFGAFLSRAWRQNDIMWGRLDGAERIIRALLPDPGDEVLRDELVSMAQAEILKEELRADVLFAWVAQYVKQRVGPNASEAKLQDAVKSLVSQSKTDPAMAILRDLLGGGNIADYEKFARLFYQMPSDPEPKEVLEWTGRAAAITGDMLKGLKEGGTALAAMASKLKALGVLLTRSVGFAVPNSLRDVLLRYWLVLLLLASVILIVFGPFKSGEIATVGWTVLGITVALAIARLTLRDYLGRGSKWKRALAILGIGIGVLVCFVFGVGVFTIADWLGRNKEWFIDLPHKVWHLTGLGG